MKGLQSSRTEAGMGRRKLHIYKSYTGTQEDAPQEDIHDLYISCTELFIKLLFALIIFPGLYYY